MKCKPILPNFCVQQQKSKNVTGKNVMKNALPAFFKTVISMFTLFFFSLQTIMAQCVSVGDQLQGGIVFYVDNTGTGGLIAAPSDQAISNWGCQGTLISYANGNVIGDGLANTNSIVSQCTSGSVAAQHCTSLNIGGYTDWYLPARSELALLYQNRNIVGGFSQNVYWTSNQFSGNDAYWFHFISGMEGHNLKNQAAGVRAIRKFSNACASAEALDLDGTNDYVSLGNSLVLKPTSGLTVETWLYENDWSALPLNKNVAGNTQNGGYQLQIDGQYLKGWVHRNNVYGISAYDLRSLSPGWHHLAISYDGRYNRLYVDCNLVAQDDAGGQYPIQYSSFSNSTLIGAEAFEADVPEPATFLPGKMDELRFWNYARNCTELCGRKNCELNPAETGLLAYYKFNQGIVASNNTSITTLVDATANNITGSLHDFTLNGAISNFIAPGAVSTGTNCSSEVDASQFSAAFNLENEYCPEAIIDLHGLYTTPEPLTETWEIFITHNNCVPDEPAIHSATGSNFVINPGDLEFQNESCYLVRHRVQGPCSDETVDHCFCKVVPDPQINAGNDTTICKNNSITLTTVQVAGYSYEWHELPSNSLISSGNTVSITPLVSTQYHLHAHTVDGCTINDTINITVTPCCNSCLNPANLANSLIIHTGYNENNGNAIAVGQQDMNWKLTQQPASSSISLPANPFAIYYNPFSNPNFFPFTNSQWISPNANGNAGPNITGLPYTFEYSFCLCENDSVTFDFHTLVDDSLLVYIDNYSIQLAYQSVTITGQQAGQQNYLYKIYLPKGKHYLKADLRNHGGPLGFDLGGTISGAHLLKYGACDETFKYVHAGPDQTIIIGNAATLTATGCTGSLQWYELNNGIANSIAGANSAVLNVSPTSPTCYYVSCCDEDNCCLYDTVCVNVAPVPCQAKNANWYFGKNAGLKFSVNGPAVITNSAIDTEEGSSAVSDMNGNLLFYTDGVTVWNKNNIVMPNGTGLFGDVSGTQSALIVPMPGNPTRYYVFTSDQGGYYNYNRGINYSVVDITLNAGLGDVDPLYKNVNVPVSGASATFKNATEKLTIVKHENGQDAWILIHQWSSASFYAYLLTGSGLNASPVTSSVGTSHMGSSGFSSTIGYLKANCTGTKLAAAIYQDVNKVEVFDFNKSTGTVSVPVKTYQFNLSGDNPYGVEFSPNGQYLYVSCMGYTVDAGKIYQCDLTSNAVPVLVPGSAVTNSRLGAMLLGPDKKIYVARFSTANPVSYLGIINAPDNPASNCDFNLQGVNISPGISRGGLPNFVSCCEFYPPCNTIADAGTDVTICNTTSVILHATTVSGYTYQWNLVGNTAIAGTQPSLNVFPTVSTCYELKVTDQDGCNKKDTVCVNVITYTPVPVVTGLVNVCPYVGTNIPITYIATSVGATSFTWVIPPNVTVVAGAGTANLTVTFQNGFTSQPNKQLRVSASSPCGNSAQTIHYLVAQTPNTPQPIVASSNNVCAIIGTSGTITYTIPSVPGASSYNWAAQAGTTTIGHPNGAGTVNDTTVTVSFSTGFTNSSISVSATNPCLTSGARSLAIARSIPATPGLISGPGNACPYIAPGGTTATYSVQAVTNALSYTWAVPAGAIGLTGQGSNTISFTYPASFVSGSVSVTATNGCGTSPARVLVINKLNPAGPGVIDVIQVSPCGDRVYSYTLASFPTNATLLQWTVPANAIIVSGQGTTGITVSYPPAAVNGNVTVQSFSNCGSSGIRTIAVKFAACPAVPRTYAKGSTAEKNTVEKISKDAMKVNLFPNPSTIDFNLQVSTAGQSTINVSILDLQGRALKSFTIQPYQLIKIGSDLQPGVYMLEIRQANIVQTTRLLKL